MFYSLLPTAWLLAAPVPVGSEVAVCGAEKDASAVCLTVYRATNNAILASGSDLLLVKPGKILLILAIAFVFNRLITKTVSRLVHGMKEKVGRTARARREHPPKILEGVPVPSVRGAQRAQTIGALLRSAATFTVWGVATLMVMSELGLNLGPLIAGAGIVGVAIGFGAQNLVRDFLSGMFMLVEDQYGVGDIIDAGPASGTVEEVSLRTTRLRDVQGVVWHIPNGSINRIGNKSQQWSKALLDVEVAYATDVEFACKVLKQTALEMWQEEEWQEVILEEPEVWGVENLGADGMVIRMVVKTTPSDQWKVARQLRARIKGAFDDVGIEIPFPQRTVWHRGQEVTSDREQPARAAG
ncbi:MAG: mechanosensitive ion channel family protein [Actinobacteria bacterium]|nr:mechanosensitive ion channel family protein [Actinomycetota bacterium]